MNLCLLADVKTLLDIADTSQDAKLALLGRRVSGQIRQELNYNPVWTSYVGERHAVNNRQLLQLGAQPIQSISSITIDGIAIPDFEPVGADPDNDAAGLVYRGVGWCGNWYTRGLENDPVAGFHSILVSYVGGWHLPGDPDYEEDDPGSLPDSLAQAAIQATCEAFNILESGGVGMQDHNEGKVKDTFRADAGLSQTVLDMLSPFKRTAVA
jgi:hypothetical protein